MSNCANLMKDANPKVAVTALDVVEICIVNSFAVFQPLSNMVFDLLIAKFGDIKVAYMLKLCDLLCGSFHLCLMQLATRTRATDTMIALINAVGLSTALEKLLVRQLLHVCVSIATAYFLFVVASFESSRVASARTGLSRLDASGADLR